MTILLMAFALSAIAMPILARALSTRVFYLAAIIPLAAFVHAVLVAPTVLGGGEIVESIPWVASLDLSVSMRMDALSWLLALVVSGVGALVLVYCGRYFKRGDAGAGRFVASFVAFAGAMYGLVLADDVYLLFVFWEATSVFSYLLIGHYSDKRVSRGAALQALLVTTLGGLVMFVGLVILAVTAGTSRLSELVAAPPEGTLVTVALLLVLVGAISKSAIVPFHFWLPAAMAAPTPVSAYLHAAAMVKAGVYLVIRLAPGYGDSPGWQEILVILGVATMLIGGVTAIRQLDLKLVLAYGTVSQLGFLMVASGFASRYAIVGAVALLLGHALFKSALFLVVGIIDRVAGTRDLRKLSGLGRRAPALAVIAALALLSMMGIPPLFGFVAKEAVLGAFVQGIELGDPIAWVALVGTGLGSALTVAYSLRFFWGAFFTKTGVEPVDCAVPKPLFLAPPAVVAVLSLLLGPLAPFVDVPVAIYADTVPGEGGYLALWHGLEPALGVTVLSIVLGVILFLARGRVTVRREGSGRPIAAELFWDSVTLIDRLAARVTSLTQRGSLPFYLAVIFGVFALAVGLALALTDSWPSDIRLWDYPAQAVIGALMIVAAIATTFAAKRFQAVVLVGVTGFGMAALFALHGAPDLALTQSLVELVTLIAFVLVLRRLPARLGDRNGSSHRGLRAAIGITVGVVMGAIMIVALGARVFDPVSVEWPQLAVDEGHGRNVVNVALVDIRGWDTMGELSVVIAAATGVASLVFLTSRTDDLPRMGRREAQRVVRKLLGEERAANGPSANRGSWLLAGRALAPSNRSIMLEVVVRLTFHATIVLSLYLVFAGHNTPGGGFAGGLVAGMALVARYLAGGRFELGAAAPVSAGALLGGGLILATGTALVPLFFGWDALESTWWTWQLWPFGEIEFVTSTVFDIGVYLVVVGLALDVLRSLGAQVDVHEEESQREGVTQ